MLFFIIPYYLLATDYCMNIATYDFKKENKLKIQTILLDVSHPSYIIKNQKILIYSGKFKTFEKANKLLGLTKIRYKNAKVSTCNSDMIMYREQNLIFDDELKSKNSKGVLKKDRLYNHYYKGSYCLQVLDVNLNYDKNKINKILKKLPSSYVKIENRRLKIYSGRFESINSVKIIKGLIKN